MVKSLKEKMLERRISRLEKLFKLESEKASRSGSLRRLRCNEGSSWFNAFQIDDIQFSSFTVRPENESQVKVLLKGARISCVSACDAENSIRVDSALRCSDIELVLTYIGNDEDLNDDVSLICDIVKDIDLSGDKTLLVGGGHSRMNLDLDSYFDVVNGFSYKPSGNQPATLDLIDKDGFVNAFEIDSMFIRGCADFEEISQQLSESFYDDAD